MGGGKSGGSAGKKGGQALQIPDELIQASEELTEISRETFDIAKPGLELGGQVVEDVLRTGGSQALTPSVQQAVEQTRAAASQAARQTGENLTRAGVTGTERQAILAQQAIQGQVAAAQVGPNFALPLVQQAALQSLGGQALGIQGVGQAAQALAGGTRTPANPNKFENFAAFGQGFSSIAGSFAGAGGASDKRLKTNLTPVAWDWIPDMPANLPRQAIGFVAQEVEEVYPDLVQEGPLGYKVVNYAQLSVRLMQRIHELEKELA